jgi:hypothetical protein
VVPVGLPTLVTVAELVTEPDLVEVEVRVDVAVPVGVLLPVADRVRVAVPLSDPVPVDVMVGNADRLGDCAAEAVGEAEGAVTKVAKKAPAAPVFVDLASTDEKKGDEKEKEKEKEKVSVDAKSEDASVGESSAKIGVSVSEKVEGEAVSGVLSETAAKLLLVHDGQKERTPLRAAGGDA